MSAAQSESTDQDIVAAVIGGDVDSYGEIMQRYEARLTRYAVYLTHDEAAAADIVQTTFIKAYENLRGYRPDLKFSSWIYRIAHNAAIDHIRQERHIAQDADIEAAEDTREDTIVQEIDRAIAQKDVQACLDALEPKYREVLMLQYYEAMSYQEISDVLHIPAATVGVWASRGKTKLRAICERKGVRR